MTSTYAGATASALRERGLAFRRLRISASVGQTLFAAGLYLALACFVSWPIAIHPGSRVFGPIGSDLTGEMSYYSALAQAHAAPFLPGTVHAFNAPEGRDTQWALNFSILPSSALLWLGALTIGSVATLGYWGILSFALTALSMFLFIRWLTGNWQAAIVAGLAFGFWPYQFVAMNQPLGDSWVVVLFVWRMLVAIERPTIRNGLLAGAATALALMWVQYFLLIAGLVWGLLAVGALVVGWRRHEFGLQLRAQLAGALPVLTALVAVLFAGVATSFSSVPTRGVSELTTYSARPAMYLLPDFNNPFLGKLSKQIIRREFFSPTSTVAYSDIYLGISVILLALVGMWLLVRVIRRRGLSFALSDRRILAAVLLSITAAVALIFSLPPQVSVAGIRIPLPMDIVAQVTTVFRTTARFGLIVMLGLCVLAGFALSELLPRIKNHTTRLLVVAAIGLVVTCDLWARPPFQISHVRPPSVFQVLAHQPAGVYAEYPLDDGYQFGDSIPAFYQSYAGPHDLFTGFFPGTTSELRKLDMSFPLAKYTTADLAELGVRYMIIDKVVPPPALYPAPGAQIPGAQLIAKDSYGSLYRITAAPPAVSSFTDSGFAPPVNMGPANWHWMTSDKAQIEIRRTGPRPGLVRVTFEAGSYLELRHLRITDGRGHLLYSAVISPSTRTVSFDARVGHRAVLNLSVWPGPVSPHSLDPKNPITWTLGLLVSDPLSVRLLQSRAP